MKLFPIIGLLFILLASGCNKVKQHAKKLDGTWTIYSYQKIENGFVTNLEVEGTITFVTQKDGTFTYEENYTYFTATDTVVSTRKGTGRITGKRGDGYELNITDPTPVALNPCNIFLISKDDLKIQNNEVDGGHLFVLQKL